MREFRLKNIWAWGALACLLAGPLTAASDKLILPEGGKAVWMLGAAGLKKLGLSEVPLFSVSSKGKLWLLPQPSVLMQLDPPLVIRFDAPVDDLLFLDNGKLLLASGGAVGGLGLKDPKAKGILKGSLKAPQKLPQGEFSLGRAGKAGYLAYDIGSENETRVVYLFDLKGGRKKIFEWNESIQSALVQGDALYVASDKAILKIGLKDASKERLLRHDGGITGLAWAGAAGLVFSTPQGLYKLPSAYLPVRFMDCDQCQLSAHGDDVYVLARRPHGILKISGLAALRLKPESGKP